MDRAGPPLVSVMISTRNRLPLLRRALESIRRQDYPRLDLVVADDASEDGTADYLRAKHPEIRLLRFDENRGLIAARNSLMKAARGAYIVSLDDDGYFADQDVISRVVERMEREPEIAVVAFRVVSQEAEIVEGERREHYASVFPGGAHCLRKVVLSVIGDYREFFFRQGEEVDLALRLLDKGYRILHFPRAAVVHEHGQGVRDPGRIAMFNARNVLLRSWINEPFPWWVLSTVNTVARYVIHGFKDGTVSHVLTGFRGAVRELRRVKVLRRPVSPRAMALFLTLRRGTIRSAAEVQKAYAEPSASLAALWSEAVRRSGLEGRRRARADR